MIGMMYLVLTALLALQVSNAVLEKFAIINVTLGELVTTTEGKNVQQVTAIQDAGKGKTNPKVITAVENAQKVREATKKANEQLEALKKKMVETSGATEIDEKVINDHSSKIATMMIDPRSNVGKDFEKVLVDYVNQISTLTGEKFEPLAKAPKDIEFFANDPDHNKKDFLTFMFENTPAIAALASVTEIQSQMMEYESKALDKLAKDAEAGTLKFDKIVPMVRPEASIVAAGSKYKADMFITASAEGITPEMFRNGQKLQVVPDPVTKIMTGKVEFPASATNYDANGLSKQSFVAEIRVGDGPDDVFKTNVEYFVAKPVIRVVTGNAPTLYMNCGNNVTIEVPALGTNYNPTFSPKGAEVIKGDGPGKVFIIPTERKVAITVLNAGATIGVQPFDVKPVPKPRYVARENSGKEVDLKLGAKGASLTGLRITADPDENFKQEVPKDAVYRIKSMEVILARGTQQVSRINATSELIDLAAWRSQFRPGDRIVVDIKSVTRRTYKGNEEKVDVVSGVLNIPIQ